MNSVNLIGRLTRDPEMKFGQSGKAYTRFSLAVKRPFSKDETDFINCVSFGKTAEIIGEYVRKGHNLAVEGSLRMNNYEKNGEKRTTFEVSVNSVTLIEGKGNDNSVPKAKEVQQKNTENNPKNISSQNDSAIDTFDEDEFPF